MEHPKPSFAHSNSAKYVAEFIGTYFLVLTIGLNTITGSIGGALSIGAMLMVMVFSAGSVSGAHFNPAVSFAVWLSSNGGTRGTRKFSGALTATHFFFYCCVQCLGAWCAGLTYYGMTGKTVTLAPVGKYTWGSAMVCEFWYSMVLCYVVLNVATTKRQECNEYFGLAIGFTVVAAALAIGGISGCSLNPAVTFGLMSTAALAHRSVQFKWFVYYFFTPFLGALCAYAAFYFVRKEDEFPYNEGLKMSQGGRGNR